MVGDMVYLRLHDGDFSGPFIVDRLIPPTTGDYMWHYDIRDVGRVSEISIILRPLGAFPLRGDDSLNTSSGKTERLEPRQVSFAKMADITLRESMLIVCRNPNAQTLLNTWPGLATNRTYRSQIRI